jgi:hypothetical protein
VFHAIFYQIKADQLNKRDVAFCICLN